MTTTRPHHILMCPPDHYEVDYVINPWMEGNVHRSSQSEAVSQWQGLHAALAEHANVDLVKPAKGWPDMVFTANAGLVLGDKAVLSRFFHPERQGEEPFFKAWFEDNDFEVYELPRSQPFEGAGDALFDRGSGTLWAAYGFRSELDSHAYIAQWLDVEVLSLRLIDPRFYHLDTCFCPLDGGDLLYYPPAFDAYSNALIERRIPADRRIVVPEPDAVNFACNAVSLGDVIVMNQITSELENKILDRGYRVVQTPLTEFLKAGGAAKCLTLRTTEPLRGEPKAKPSVDSRILHLEGQLLDAGILNAALDLIQEQGGSTKVLSFNLGAEREDTSSANVRVSAPSAAVMDDIVTGLIETGALSGADEEGLDAMLATVEQAGVAPQDFCVTTMHPTEVRVGGRWIPVTHMRRDAAICVTRTQGETTAQCRLLRDLVAGDEVVTGVAGLRTRPVHFGRPTTEAPTGSEVASSEHVAAVVEQTAWRLHRLREQGGKIAVTAGPGVIRTGGGEQLARLIRRGYVQRLLAGNALAVHDMERAVKGAHGEWRTLRRGDRHHHLRVINAVRRCGGIANAVEEGLVSRGVLYECVQAEVPFCLAGSIRDDGPLPDTEMDLLEAQAEYARLLEGVDMTLMLSTTLHSDGVLKMLPAHVRRVCVDSNPAVVARLDEPEATDSVGVVTDVGLFLSLLNRQLDSLESSIG